MICALCKKREADRTNTHYLTDSIIRGCLNLDGSNKRERGLYFDISNDNPFIEFNFQRGTSVDKLEASLGRPATGEEIENAKKIPFSVDYVFCNDCEQLFGEIENEFKIDILQKFRQGDLSKSDTLNLVDARLIRLFFYLQIWRTFICRDDFIFSETVAEELRRIILHNKDISLSELNHLPLSITYLETLGAEFEYTTNYVGIAEGKNPNIIFMNNFVIQFFENREAITYLHFYGLNSEADFKKMINYNEERFVFNIFHNEKRKEFLKPLYTAKAISIIEECTTAFVTVWQRVLLPGPSNEIIDEYINELIGGDELNILRYTKKSIIKMTTLFILKKNRL